MRNVINLNSSWKFIQQDAGLPETLPADWQDIDLPHSWNAVDGQDGNGSYDRGKYWYAKTFETPKQPLKGGRVYVEILAAGQRLSPVRGLHILRRPLPRGEPDQRAGRTL